MAEDSRKGLASVQAGRAGGSMGDYGTAILPVKRASRHDFLEQHLDTGRVTLHTVFICAPST
jgi:hypothetical protein